MGITNWARLYLGRLIRKCFPRAKENMLLGRGWVPWSTDRNVRKRWGKLQGDPAWHPSPNYSGSASMTGLDWHTCSTFPVGFLEKNRDVLSSDILTLAYSSKNKFLKEIFNVESTETKSGNRTIFKAHRGSQLFKVGSCCPSWLPQPSGPGSQTSEMGRFDAWSLSAQDEKWSGNRDGMLLFLFG